MSTATAYKYLAPNPKSSYKQLFVKGTRIRARVLYGCHMCEDDPRTPEEIAQDYNLPVEAVKEAIAYCASDPPALLEDYRREGALMEASGMNDPIEPLAITLTSARQAAQAEAHRIGLRPCE